MRPKTSDNDFSKKRPKINHAYCTYIQAYNGNMIGWKNKNYSTVY